MATLTDALCTRCGLCCDGSLFADVELSGSAEAARIEILGLEVEEDESDGAQLIQPCAALQRRRCAIYAHRPRSCRTFECALLRKAQSGAVGVEQATERIAEAHRRIARVKRLLARLGHRSTRLPLREECAAALAAGTSRRPAETRRRAALEAALAAAEEWIRTTFLR